MCFSSERLANQRLKLLRGQRCSAALAAVQCWRLCSVGSCAGTSVSGCPAHPQLKLAAFASLLAWVACSAPPAPCSPPSVLDHFGDGGPPSKDDYEEMKQDMAFEREHAARGEDEDE